MSALRRLGPWRVPLAWALVILVATSVPIPSVGWTPTGIPADKVAHVLLYLGLGWGSARALRSTGRTGPAAIAAVLGAGMLFAALDEAHQAWLASRTASLADWVADVVGLAAGFVVVALTTSTPSLREEGGGDERAP